MPESAIHLATGIALRGERLLMVASHYANQPHSLWNLPGGRQQPGELLVETVVREFYEETNLRVRAGELAYVSESYDGDRHFLNATFLVEVIESSSFDPSTGSGQAELRMTILSACAKRSPERSRRVRMTPGGPALTPGDHVVAVEWVPIDAVRERVVVRVVREPLVAYLEGRSERRYAGYHDAGITIEWPADSL
ncbi:MAG: NUDIX domain-containing protein [Candidatus Cybelea sp.]